MSVFSPADSDSQMEKGTVTAPDLYHTSFAHREKEGRRTTGRIREKDDGKNEKERKK